MSARCRRSWMRSRSGCSGSRRRPSRCAGRANGPAAGCCSTTSTSWCTFSTARSASSTRWTGCGRTARRSRSSTGTWYRPSAPRERARWPRRAADTAAPLAELTGLPVWSDPRLRERSFGRWEGLHGDEIAERYPEEYGRWQAGKDVDGCGVEELDEVAKRASAALREAADQVPDGTVVVFSHGAAVRYGLAMLLGWPATVPLSLGALGICR